MDACRLCGNTNLRSVVDLGASPPCERFLTSSQLELAEPTYPLHLRICSECLLLQIPSLIEPEENFTDYAYYSSYSDSWVCHARTYVNDVSRRLGLDSDSFVVEVASNDGYLLQHLVADGVPCLGIEPSVNVSEAARVKGIPTRTDFLDERVADEVRIERGPADLVIANNVWAHIPDLLGFTQGLRRLVADDGMVTIEVHHALNLITQAQFDTIYHEHFHYWTVLAARRALATAGLVLIDVELLSTHGGSLRLWAQPEAGNPTVLPSVADVIDLEIAAGLDRVEGYEGLSARVSEIRNDLMSFLLDCNRRGTKVAAYGAPGKGNTLLNYCGIRPDLLSYAVDRNPYKHGRFTPGTRIPVLPPEALDADKPEMILVLPWNLATEISEQLAYTAEWGAKLVFPLPHLMIKEAGA
jgi:SAM-dependent methyltransferase